MSQNFNRSLHDALPIMGAIHGRTRQNLDLHEAAATVAHGGSNAIGAGVAAPDDDHVLPFGRNRSEEHTPELQSLRHLVCRLLLEKKKMQVSMEVLTNKT